MGYAKRAAPRLRVALKGMLFIGFSIQIVLGICWMCCNFGQAQGFGEADSALYGGLVNILGERREIVYALQLTVAFFAGFLFLQSLRPVGAGLAVWRGLALLTVPFAMQCHLSLQPYSLMGSCFLLLLLAVLKAKISGKRVWAFLLAAAVCGALHVGLSGAADPDRLTAPGHSLARAAVSRFAWPTLWNDLVAYGEELRDILEPVAWEASLSPDNISLAQERLESQVGKQAAEEYYLQMARTGWERHGSMVLRQIGWDALGYAATSAVFPLQMEGRAYDSYSGRNYEVMRESAPRLTGAYVDYGCWWFLWMLALSALLLLFRRVDDRTVVEGRGSRGKAIVSCAGICILASGILVAALTMRGAGRMDYRETIAVNALWFMGPLLLMGGQKGE